MTDEMTDDRPKSRFFRARVSAITDLTPTFRRFTFGGDDLADYGDTGFDQRIKIDAAKNDPRIGSRWTQHHIDLGARMQPNAGSANQRFQGALFKHVFDIDRELANCSTAGNGPAALSFRQFLR